MTPLQPLPDHDPLTLPEAAECLGMKPRAINRYLKAGRFEGAWQTTLEARGHWRIPRETVAEMRRQLGVGP